MVDVSGRVVRELRPTGRTVLLQRDGLGAGMYLLRVSNKEGVILHNGWFCDSHHTCCTMKISRTHLQRSLPNVAIVLFYCALSPEADAQPSYVRTYSVPPNTVMHGCDVTDDDGLIMCGTVDDSLGLLIRLDVAGNTLWTRTYSAIGTNDGGTFGGSGSLNSWMSPR